MYIYRDDSEPAPPSRTRAEDDAAYWYDLVDDEPGPQHEDGRGPFEPLVSSTETETPRTQESAETSNPDTASPARDGGAGVHERERARTLDQLKDLYLTAEAIGEHNVDRHFNELLAQQRLLIRDYFDHSNQAADDGPESAQAAQAADDGPESAQAAQAADERPPAGDATPPEGVTVRAVPPRTW